MSIGCLIGGKDLQAEAERVGQLNIVVASPGRLLQHIDESPMWDTSKLMILGKFPPHIAAAVAVGGGATVAAGLLLLETS